MTIKHMYMTPLAYEDFAGRRRTTQLHFHLTPREIMDWMMDNPEAARQLQVDLAEVQETMAANLDEDASVDSKNAILRLVRLLAELSYGVPIDDEVFDKSGLQRFVHSAAYDAFRLFLFENLKELEQFQTTLLSEEVMTAFAERMQALSADEPAALPAAQKDPRKMSKAELQALMAERFGTPELAQ